MVYFHSLQKRTSNNVAGVRFAPRWKDDQTEAVAEVGYFFAMRVAADERLAAIGFKTLIGVIEVWFEFSRRFTSAICFRFSRDAFDNSAGDEPRQHSENEFDGRTADTCAVVQVANVSSTNEISVFNPESHVRRKFQAGTVSEKLSAKAFFDVGAVKEIAITIGKVQMNSGSMS